MIPVDKIELIKNTAQDNIVDVIGDFVSLKKKGNLHIGLSPFNNERNPSFCVHTAKGIFKDFSSGNGGDVIRFLMSLNSWGYIDSLKYLAKKFSIDLENNDFVYEAKKKEAEPVKPPSFIDYSEVKIGSYENNALFVFMSGIFGSEPILNIFELYQLTTINDWVIFWQIDVFRNVRSGKYIKYKSDGHRDKEIKASWHHARTIEYMPVYPDYNLVQCFFGEHLVSNDIRKPIAIVESEKTALVATLLMPQYFWLACGSKHGLNDIKCEVLKNRSVTLFPDLGAYDEWKEKAKIYNFNISNHIEKYATDDDRKNGLDLADFLLR